MTPINFSGKGPSLNGVGISKKEIRITVPMKTPSLNFLWASLGQHFALLTDESRFRLGNSMAANCSDFELVVAECKAVYATKRNTSLKHVESEEAFLTEIEKVRRYHAAAALGN